MDPEDMTAPSEGIEESPNKMRFRELIRSGHVERVPTKEVDDKEQELLAQGGWRSGETDCHILALTSRRRSRAGGNLAPLAARKRRIPPLPIRGEDAANAAGEGTGVGGYGVGSRFRGNDEAPGIIGRRGALRPVYGAVAPNGFPPTQE